MYSSYTELDRGDILVQLMWKLKKESCCNSSQNRAMRCFLWKTDITVSQHWNWQNLEIPQNLENRVLSVLSSKCQKKGVLGVFTVQRANSTFSVYCMTFLTCSSVLEFVSTVRCRRREAYDDPTFRSIGSNDDLVCIMCVCASVKKLCNK